MGVLGDAWAWLDANSKQVGAMGSIVFGVSSAVVAWVALRLNYANIYGFRPVIIVSGCGWMHQPRGNPAILVVNFEMLNRRRYPIVVRNVSIAFESAKLTEWLIGEKAWSLDGNVFSRAEDVVIEANGRNKFKLEAGVWGVETEDFKEHFVIHIEYTDPRRDGTRKEQKRHEFRMKDIIMKYELAKEKWAERKGRAKHEA